MSSPDAEVTKRPEQAPKAPTLRPFGVAQDGDSSGESEVQRPAIGAAPFGGGESSKQVSRDGPAKDQFRDIFRGDDSVRGAGRLTEEAWQAKRDQLNRDVMRSLEAQAVQEKAPQEQRKPAELDDLPEIRDDTVYACVSSIALRRHGERPQYTVPAGFVGLVTNLAGTSPRMVLSAEQVAGDFVLHLFREDTINLNQTVGNLVSSDGFAAQVTAHYSVRLPRRAASALGAFVTDVAEGRTHLSAPVLQSRFGQMLSAVFGARTRTRTAEDLIQHGLSEDEVAAADDDLHEKFAASKISEGLTFLGLNQVTVDSPEYTRTKEEAARTQREQEERTQREAREAEERAALAAREALERQAREVKEAEERAAREAREAEERAARETAETESQRRRQVQQDELRAIADKNALGLELNRAELGKLLDAAQYNRRIQALEQEKELVTRERDLDRFQLVYREERLNAEAALRRIAAERQTQVDRQVLETYTMMVEDARARLAEDHLLVHILSIRDEAQKAYLLDQYLSLEAGKRLAPEAYTQFLQTKRSGVFQTVPEPKPELAIGDSRAIEAVKPTNGTKTTEPAPVETQGKQAESKPVPTRPSAELVQVPVPASVQATEAVTEAAQQARPGMDTVRLAPEIKPVALDESRAECMTDLTRLPEAGKDQSLRWILLTGGRNVYFAKFTEHGRPTAVGRFAALSDGPLGSLRSLTLVPMETDRRLAIGARRGVYAWDPVSGGFNPYPIGDAFNPTFGVNSAIAVGGKYYATHSEFGLLRWNVPAPRAPATLLLRELTGSARTCRSLFLDSGRWPTFASGNRLVAVEHGFVARPAAIYEGAPAQIIVAFPVRVPGTTDDGHFWVACEDGSVARWHLRDPRRCETVARIGGTFSDATVSGDGSSIVLCAMENWVKVFDTQRNVVARYDAPLPIRLAREFGGYVMGVTGDRTMLYLWESTGDGAPISEVPLPEPCYEILGA